ncbi:hypothetical protein [Streptomyces albireticuli]|uniref:Uncharacterized protein n=1 Tax=Streptomyces albireticuli TaxID=1940 RepID=A0A2A2D605_9ACTN|nr:hypothetical protein [Streptomyces albireticuli]MCD9146038.1 hypothetical protein [Streptomyces albireticuli]MCD9165819.1 hypothetical protein [Streptomyces albireticuli]MCD9196036.1 hypothetical protein [Streptomyces albireticuli]PAU46877.1 hypothetical protein CK936_21465 [Streptomyces albireticuli]
MQTTPTDSLDLDVPTFARPVQQRRYAAAMEQIAARRAPGSRVRAYVSAGPRAVESPNWDNWLEHIAAQLPDGVELLHYRNTFTEDRPYGWDALADTLDGLIVVGKQKRPGGRVYLLGPVARLELRSLIATKPVLLFAHTLGLIPAIDCKSQVMPRDTAPRLKLTAPKRWQRDSPTLQAALTALTPPGSPADDTQAAQTVDHLALPFATTR